MNGVILRKDNIGSLNVSDKQFSRICESLIDTHADLHRLDFSGLSLAQTAKPQGYAQRQLDGWCDRYEKARTPNAPKLASLVKWLRANLPPDTQRPALIHNDFKLDNLLLDPSRDFAVSGVLDWEMATIGDPLMDLGCSLAYWIERADPWYMRVLRTMPSTAPGAWTRRRMVERYAARTGADVSRMDFYYVFGLFRIAGIAQQIYYRYYHGQTRDKRFRKLILVVYALEATAKRAIRRSSL
jgi:aminoglycoside phosphotransferase (APT) family kinase protein